MSLPILDIAAEALHEDHVPLVAEALVQVNHREEKSSFRKDMCTLLPDSGQTTKLANENEKSLTKQAQQQALEMNFMNSLMEGHPSDANIKRGWKVCTRSKVPEARSR